MNCTRCLRGNPDEAKFCMHCGKRLQLPSNNTQAPIPTIVLLPIFIVVFLGSVLLVLGLRPSQTKEDGHLEIPPSPTPPHRIPTISEAEQSLRPIGFQLTKIDETHLKGKLSLSGTEYHVVLFTFDQGVNTLRLQVWGRVTEKIRKQLLEWATKILTHLKMGSVPEQTQLAIFSGSDTSDQGIYNGHCGVGVLQKPVEQRSLENISLDLIFRRD